MTEASRIPVFSQVHSPSTLSAVAAASPPRRTMPAGTNARTCALIPAIPAFSLLLLGYHQFLLMPVLRTPLLANFPVPFERTTRIVAFSPSQLKTT
jgi:hypothetical protein